MFNFENIKILIKIIVFCGILTLVGAVAWYMPEEMLVSILFGIALVNIVYVVWSLSEWCVNMLFDLGDEYES